MILVFALILRLKYLNFNQPLWWDEAEYMSIAKHWAYKIPFVISIVRPFLFSFFAAIIYKMGIGDWIIRIIELIISLTGVTLIYLLGRRLFSPLAGLIASGIMSFFYLDLFYMIRLMVDIPSMVLMILTFYLFWEGYIFKKSYYYIWAMGFFMGLNYTLRFPSALAGAIILFYLIITEGLKFLKNKHLWIAMGICFLVMMPYFVYFYFAFDRIPVIQGVTYGLGEGRQFGFYLKLLPTALQSNIPFVTQNIPVLQLFLVFFVFGLGYMVFNLALGLDLVRKGGELRKYVFMLLWLVMPFVFFSLIWLAEDRYMFYIYPAIFLVTSLALTKMSDYLKKYNKVIPYIIIGVVIFLGMYTQLRYADNLIKSKADSYVQLKEAGFWIKEHSDKKDIVMSVATSQLTYYAEREILAFSNEEEFIKLVKERRPKYLILTALERSPDWSYTWPQNNVDKVRPVQAYFIDAEKKQPILVIYEFIYS